MPTIPFLRNRPPTIRCGVPAKRPDQRHTHQEDPAGRPCAALVTLPARACLSHRPGGRHGAKAYWRQIWVPSDADLAAHGLTEMDPAELTREAPTEPAQTPSEALAEVQEPAVEPQDSPRAPLEAPVEATPVLAPIPQVVEVAKMTPAQLAAHIAKLRGIKGENGV